MCIRTITAATAVAALSIGAAAAAVAAPEKVEVCHVDGQGRYNVISISDNAFEAHEEHGDFAPNANGDCAPAPVVTLGYLSEQTQAAGVRWKGANTGGEQYVGVPNLGDGTNRSEANVTWGTSNPVTFSHDGAGGLTATANGVTTTYEITAPNCPIESWDTMTISVKDQASDDPADADITFDNVVFNTDSLGTFDPAGSYQDWTVTGADFGQPFTLTGTINTADGDFDGNERNKVEVRVGCNTAS